MKALKELTCCVEIWLTGFMDLKSLGCRDDVGHCFSSSSARFPATRQYQKTHTLNLTPIVSSSVVQQRGRGLRSGGRCRLRWSCRRLCRYRRHQSSRPRPNGASHVNSSWTKPGIGNLWPNPASRPRSRHRHGRWHTRGDRHQALGIPRHHSRSNARNLRHRRANSCGCRRCQRLTDSRNCTRD